MFMRQEYMTSLGTAKHQLVRIGTVRIISTHPFLVLIVSVYTIASNLNLCYVVLAT
jgi:hypothetical protein